MTTLEDAKKMAEKEFNEEPMDSLYENKIVGIPSRMRVKRICKELNKNDKVLDVGCESGYATLQYADKATYVVGIDIVEEAVNQLRNKTKDLINVEAHVMSAHELKFDSQFDVIICTEVIEHMPDLDKVFDNFYDNLKPNGKLIITFPNENLRKLLYPIAKAFGVNTDVEEDVTLFSYSNKEIKEKIKKRFTIEKSFSLPSFFPITRFVIAKKVL